VSPGSPPADVQAGNGGLSYPYADWFAPDGPNAGCDSHLCLYDLSDFFSFGQAPHAVSPIQGAKYLTSYFYSVNPGQFPHLPFGP
jgi:hypothetical protein